MIPLHVLPLGLKEVLSFPHEDYISKLKDLLGKSFGKKRVIFTSDGRNAIYLALRALKLQPKDEVLVPGYCGSSVREAVVRVCTPVGVDVDPQTFNLDPQRIKDKMTANTKAIIVAHLYGNPCNMDEIVDIARTTGLAIIEDAAQALFAKWRDRWVGAFGDFTIFSFAFSKDITSLQGGALLSNDNIDLDRKPCRSPLLFPRLLVTMSAIKEIRVVPAFLYSPLKKHILFPYFKKKGFKFKVSDQALSNYQCFLLYRQLQRMETIIERRRANACYYSKNLEGVVSIPKETPGGTHTYYRYSIQSPRRDELFEYLLKCGIEADKMYDYTLFPEEDCPNSFLASRYNLNIPIHQNLSTKDLEKVTEAIYRFSGRRNL